jgi:hypothetical protein
MADAKRAVRLPNQKALGLPASSALPRPAHHVLAIFVHLKLTLDFF